MGCTRPLPSVRRIEPQRFHPHRGDAVRDRFFEGDLLTLEEAPYRAAAAGNPSLAHRRNHLIQRQVRLVRNQREQTVRVLLQRRRARAARLVPTFALKRRTGLLTSSIRRSQRSSSKPLPPKGHVCSTAAECAYTRRPRHSGCLPESNPTWPACIAPSPRRLPRARKERTKRLTQLISTRRGPWAE